MSVPELGGRLKRFVLFDICGCCRAYDRTMRHKLGLLELEQESDEGLVRDLLQVSIVHCIRALPNNVKCSAWPSLIWVGWLHLPLQVCGGLSVHLDWSRQAIAQSVVTILRALLAVQTMHATGADFTNTFRWLADIPLPASSSARSNATQLNGSASRDVTEDQHNDSSGSTAGAWAVPVALTYRLP